VFKNVILHELLQSDLICIPRAKAYLNPRNIFRKFFGEAMMECIAEQSNLYAVQTNLSISLMLTCKELEIFLLFY